MRPWDLGQLARAAGADSQGGGLPAGVQAIETDTRSLSPDSLFVALRGERFDGHDFVADALKAGAVAVVVDRQGAPHVPTDAPALVVEDTLVALGDMANQLRKLRDTPVVAVTGSNGKTTSKELIGAALAVRGPVHKTEGNLNNRIGVPMTLFAWRGEWVSVVEMGMNEPGEIAELTRIAEPTVGVITTVGPAHLERLGSLENIARAKGELFAGLSPSATAVINLDNPWVRDLCASFLGAQTRIGFGTGPEARVRLREVRPDADGIVCELTVDGRDFRSRVPVTGLHNGGNVAAALATCLALDVPVEDAVAALAHAAIPGGRLRILRGVGKGFSILDDSYNANPQSMAAAFASVASLAENGRVFAATGDMLELGDGARELHSQCGEAAAAAGVDRLLTLGRFADDFAAGARAAGVSAEACSSHDAIVEILRAEMRPGDWLLVKGSRGMRMERVIAGLTGGDA